MASIFCLIDHSSGYRKRISLGCSAALITARARSIAPLPPCAWWSLVTASTAPAASAASRTASISRAVSVGKRLIATTTGRPCSRMFSTCFCRFSQPRWTASTFSLISSGVPRRDRLPVFGGADDDAAEPPAQVLQVAGQGQDGHDLAGDADVEPGLPRPAV